MKTFYAIAADAVLVVHALFVLFVVLGLALIVAGGLAGWRWVRNPWFRFAHLGAIAVVAAQAWLGLVCPLTGLEMFLRARAGDAFHAGTFIGYWLGELLYFQAPSWVFTAVYTGFAALVAVTLVGVRPRPFTRHGRARARARSRCPSR